MEDLQRRSCGERLVPALGDEGIGCGEAEHGADTLAAELERVFDGGEEALGLALSEASCLEAGAHGCLELL